MKNKINISIILTILISYIGIKLIDNYKYFFTSSQILLSVTMPFIMALALAYILSPIVLYIENKLKVKRFASVSILYIFFLLCTSIFMISIYPTMRDSLFEIIEQMPLYLEKLHDFIINMGRSLDDIDIEALKNMATTVPLDIPGVSAFIVGYVGQIFETTFSISKMIVQFILAIVICFYVLLEKENFVIFTKNAIYTVFDKKVAKNIIDVIHSFNLSVGDYFRGKIATSVALSVLSFVGLYLLKSKYSLLFSVLIGIANLIPYVGAILVTSAMVLINLFYSPKIALLSLVWLLIVQQIEGAILQPKIIGKEVGLNPFLTMLSVAIGGGLFGIIGMVLSIPVMAVIKKYTSEYIDNNCKQKH